MFHNNHIYPITKKNEFDHVINPYQEKLSKDLIVSNKYNLKYKDEINVVLMKTNKFEEILNHISTTKESKYTFIYCDEDLNTLAYEIKEKYKYEPYITEDKCIITNILTSFKINERLVKINIKMAFEDIEHVNYKSITTLEYYNKFYNWKQKLDV